MRLGRTLLALGLVLGACTPPTPPPPKLVLERASFAALPGWRDDDPAAAVPALLASCKALLARPPLESSVLGLTADDWRPACTAATSLPPGDGNAARQFFEAQFVPFQALDNRQAEGTFTGYYEAELHGALQPDQRYTVPLYRRPPDLVSVDLGQFRPDWKGQHIAGHVQSGRLLPYPARHEIDAGALAGKGLELVWVDSAIDAFFLAVQGSGRVILPDGNVLRVGYDAENGRPYVSIGKVLIDRGVPRDAVDMAFIRRWIAEHGPDGTALMDENPSYIFYRELKGAGPIGSQGVALTPGRSAAVDRGFVPMGMPLWVDTSDPVEAGGRLRRLVIAQDTGGAIRGPVRADLFFGYGEAAADHAGRLKGRGGYWLLLPTTAAARQTPTG